MSWSSSSLLFSPSIPIFSSRLRFCFLYFFLFLFMPALFLTWMSASYLGTFNKAVAAFLSKGAPSLISLLPPQTTQFVFLYLNKRRSQAKLVLQKNKKKLKFGNFSRHFYLRRPELKKRFLIFPSNLFYLELRILKVLIVSLRKIIRRKKLKAFVFLCCNHAWFKKSKNARMGRGKGRFSRFVFVCTNLKPVFVFFKISKLRAVKFIERLNCYLRRFKLS